jgi:hypothetical protein
MRFEPRPQIVDEVTIDRDSGEARESRPTDRHPSGNGKQIPSRHERLAHGGNIESVTCLRALGEGADTADDWGRRASGQDDDGGFDRTQAGFVT